jgi:hypothetical protein
MSNAMLVWTVQRIDLRSKVDGLLRLRQQGLTGADLKARDGNHRPLLRKES